MKKKIVISLVLVFLMILVDSYLNPSYWVKSSIKVILFLLVPIVISGLSKDYLLRLIKLKNKNEVKRTIVIGFGIYVGIILTYLVLSTFIDLEVIKEILENNLKVNKSNFIFVAIYISFINSLIEEFFFRGYLFLGLLKDKGRVYAYTYSALLFSIYHVGIMGGWFNPSIFVLALIGLFIGGLIFNFINERNNNIVSSYMVHMMANLAINTIGLIMFDIL